MEHKTSTKSPLKHVQIAHSRPYIAPDAPSSLPFYPFERQLEDNSTWQVRAPVSNSSPTCAPPSFASQLLRSRPLVQVEPSVVLSSSTPKNTTGYHWNDSLDTHDDNCLDPDPLPFPRSYRSLTPPISLPALSPRAEDAEYSHKRSERTFTLEMNGEHMFTHVVVNPQDNDSKEDSSHSLIPPGEDGLPEDMQDMLRQLDDLASWVKAASSSRDCVSNTSSVLHSSPLTGHPGTDAGGHSTGHLSDRLLPRKGKDRLLTTSPPGIRRDLVESSRGTVPSNPTKMSPGTDRRSEGFIYVPNCNTPEFLVGSSSSPIAYPVCGYSSHPPRYSPHPLVQTHDIPYHRRFLERRSVPCPPPTSPLVSPPLGKTSFKTLFQRSRCNTTAVSRPSIPSGHVPVESALRQGKRMRLPWLRI